MQPPDKKRQESVNCIYDIEQTERKHTASSRVCRNLHKRASQLSQIATSLTLRHPRGELAACPRRGLRFSRVCQGADDVTVAARKRVLD